MRQERLIKNAASISALLLGTLLVSTGQPAKAASEADPLLRQGMYFEETINTKICGKAAAIKLYGVPTSAKIGEYLAWYKSQLKGYHYFHQVWNGRAQEMLYSPDGTSGVSLTGNQTGDGLYEVSFASINGGLTPQQMEAFGAANGTCK